MRTDLAASNSTIELTLSQYPTVRQCSVREGGTRFFLCSCNKREDAFEPTMSVTVGHIKVADVTLCSTVCRGSSPPCALVCPGRICAHMCSCVLEEFARTCALDTIELTLSQYPTVRQCSVREGGTRFFLCSCNKREDAFEPTMSVTVGHIKVADVTLCSTVCRGSSPPCALVCNGRICAHMCS